MGKRCLVFLLCGVGFLLVVGLVVLGVAESIRHEDLVDRLPGQPSVAFSQYAGYVDVDKKHLFYYFVEANEHPKKKPLIFWLNGGPGCSSVGAGAFVEIGPFYPTGDGRGLRVNPHSWNREANLLFLESPAGVGWSYSDRTSDYETGDAQIAHDTREFLLGWFRKFPAYKSNSLFLAGESYAGHYVPQLALSLLDYNKNSHDFKFKLKAIALGNPLIHKSRNEAAYQEFYWARGMISEEAWVKIGEDCNYEAWLMKGEHNNTDECEAAIADANQAFGKFIDITDVILDVCDDDLAQKQLQQGQSAAMMSLDVDVCIFKERTFYFNLPEVQKALHANRTKLSYPWNVCSGLLKYNSTDQYADMSPVLKQVLGNNIPIFIFNGDQDASVSFMTTRRIVTEIANDLHLNLTRTYTAWLHNNQTSGWAVEYGNILSFTTVRSASHMVPYSHPDKAFGILKAFLNRQKLPDTRNPSPSLL